MNDIKKKKKTTPYRIIIKDNCIQGACKKSYQLQDSTPGMSFIHKMILKLMKTDKAFNNTLIAIGSTLAELREKKGYDTIKDFVIHYDLPEIQYWRIERGKANVTLKSLVKILAIHNLSLHDFFCLVPADEHLA